MIRKCEICGGYGYCWPKGEDSKAAGKGSPYRCPSCGGDKISRKPKPK